MADLFGKPAEWRAPSGKEQACQTCGAAASCGTGVAFFCVPHAPADFWPGKRQDDPGDVL